MEKSTQSPGSLIDSPVPIKIKLAGLWASVMFCYVYGDIFGLFKPGNLQSMLDGQMGPLGPTTQGILVGTSLMMAIPSLMVFLALALRPNLNRWLNIGFGLLFTIIILITLPGAWAFYIVLGIIEMGLTLFIVWYAWKWPRNETA